MSNIATCTWCGESFKAECEEAANAVFPSCRLCLPRLAMSGKVHEFATRLDDFRDALSRDYPASNALTMLRECSGLLLVLARAFERGEAIRAMGVVGDWGYGTEIGDALAALLSSESERSKG